MSDKKFVVGRTRELLGEVYEKKPRMNPLYSSGSSQNSVQEGCRCPRCTRIEPTVRTLRENGVPETWTVKRKGSIDGPNEGVTEVPLLCLRRREPQGGCGWRKEPLTS